MKNFYLTFILLAVVFTSQAQISEQYQQMREREAISNSILFGKESQVVSANGLNYDVKYYRLNLRINPDSTSVPKYVRGSVTTYFTTGTANFSQIKFDFASALICDSVHYHNVKLAPGNVVESVDTLRINLPSPIPTSGTLDSVTVYYKGIPPVVSDFGGTTGFVNGGTNPNRYIYTLSEPYSAGTWWPCKSMVAFDKADSLDMYISTPSAFRVAGNGKRISETITGSDRLTYWKHRYAISSYQVAISVAKYVQYPTVPAIVNIGGTNMELYNLLWSSTNTASAHTALDRTADMLTVFSNRFSDYPFKNEKYGHYTFGFSGGMEHNTFSGMGSSTYNNTTDWSVIAHELGHQWFGAAVTCGSWRDIWVNEGFARYSEVVYLEGKANNGITTTPFTQRNSYKTAALAANAKPIYQADTSTMTAIFSPSVYIYERGAMFISMLRKTLGDTKFFQALKNYQTDPTLQYKNAFTDDVKRHMEAVSGLDLDEMFNDWVYKKGYARYQTAKWNNSGTQIIFQLPQTVNGASDNTHFDMPLVIKISRTAPIADTTIVLFDKNGEIYTLDNGVFTTTLGSNIIQMNLSFVPQTIQFDPESEILADASFAKDPGLTVLPLNEFEFSAQKENNTAKLLWTIGVPMRYTYFEIERSVTGSAFEKIHAQNATSSAVNFMYLDTDMPNGIIYYRIKVFEANGSSFYSKVAVINNKKMEVFEVNPNPAVDFIYVSHASAKTIKANIRIVDAVGKTVKVISGQSIFPGNKLRIPVQDIAAGTYFVEIDGSQYFKIVKKVLITK
ncbi:MAG: T9SS type A sorting domain-containing protein [Chitinophagaceae bacterium]|nr:T9SS type A sorting domain-containing protein [Chitinophagaceae bacterium]